MLPIDSQKWFERTTEEVASSVGEAAGAIEKAVQRLDSDGNLTDTGKQEKLTAMVFPAKDKIQYQLERLEEEIAAHEVEAQRALVAIPIPPADELAALGYVREVLRTRLQGANLMEISKQFDAALDLKDKLLIRALTFEAPPAARRAFKEASGGKAEPSGQVNPMLAERLKKAEEFLMPDGQKQAARFLDLAKNKQAIFGQLRGAITDLEKATIQRGKVVPGRTAVSAFDTVRL